MIEIVVFVAISLFKIVASMYNPFSVKAFGGLIFPPFIEVENFDFIGSHSLTVNSIRYPSGNLSGLFLTASLILLVSTP